jgi:hypothetical protein
LGLRGLVELLLSIDEATHVVPVGRLKGGIGFTSGTGMLGKEERSWGR